jgi:hypothetical protein
LGDRKVKAPSLLTSSLSPKSLHYTRSLNIRVPVIRTTAKLQLQDPGSATVMMPSQLRLPGRTIHSALLTTCRLHPAALASASDASATTIRSPASPSFSPSSSLRSISTFQPRNIRTQSSTESFPSPSSQHRLQTAAMSTMPATHGHNEACCNIPPIMSSGYVAKGSYEQLGGMKTCERHPPPSQFFS